MKDQNAKKKSREYFNSHRKTRLARNGYWKHDYKYQLAAIKKIRPERLIDIGCGLGGFLSFVQEKFPEIRLYALDLSEAMIEETKERLGESVTAAVGDSEDMPLESEQYQAVTCNMSIHHYPHPQKAVNEMYRILTPGGYLLINDMDCVQPVRQLANVLFPLLSAGDVKMYSRDEVERMVRKAGFRKIMYRKISPFTFQCIAKK